MFRKIRRTKLSIKHFSVFVSVLLIFCLCYERNPVNLNVTCKNNPCTRDVLLDQNQLTKRTTTSRFYGIIEEVFNKSVYCEATNLGCFQKKPKTSYSTSLHFKAQFMTHNWCFSACSSTKSNLAVLFNGISCICSQRIESFSNVLSTSNKCNVPCSGDANETCGGKEEFQIYYLKAPCQDGKHFSTSFEDSKFLGCTNIFKFSESKISFHDSKFKCFFHCNLQNQHLAMWLQTESLCYCKKHSQGFNLTKILGKCENSSMKIYRTFAENKDCKPPGFLLPGTKVKRFALTGDPGSGNTWSRHLFEQATGIYTGSIYQEPNLYMAGFLAERLPIAWNRSFIIKDHMVGRSSMEKFDGAILILRNPYKARIADYNRMKAKYDHVGIANPQVFYAEGFTNYLSNAQPWNRVVTWVIEAKKPYHIIVYENLVNDTIGEMRKAMEFLERHSGFKTDNLEQRFLCLRDNMQGSFKRKKRPLAKDPFPRAMKIKINSEIKAARKYLQGVNSDVMIPPYEMEVE